MTDKTKKALKLALEALEKSHTCPLLPDDCAEAITAIKEALAQPEQEPVAWRVFDKDPFDGRDHRWVYFDKSEFVDGIDPTTHFNLYPLYTSPPASKPEQQESVANVELDVEVLRQQLLGRAEFLRNRGEIKSPQLMELAAELIYTSLPAQRTWVGLSDGEIEQACVPLGAAMLSFTEVARAIEAKLKEKNT